MTYTDARGKQIESVTYSEALLKMHGLAADNQIDEHDIAGEAALADQRRWQQAALDAVEEFVRTKADEIDSIQPELSAFQDYCDADWRADRSMDPSDPLNAIRIVFDMARSGALDPDGRDAVEMEDEIDAQQQALDMTLDILALHGERLRDLAAPAPTR
jgi:hypothetical protein